MINYYLLTKPGIILGNLLTVAAGFLLASNGTIDLSLFLATFGGIALIMASGCVFNNCIDLTIDSKMKRTQRRPLVIGVISRLQAILFATALGLAGCALLFFFVNLLTVGIAASGFFLYVVCYSLWKCRTIYGTAIGSLAGAVPPVVGYCAVSNRLDVGAVILFLMMTLWQMPHFFAIAILYLEDYRAANIPVLPLAKGLFRTKIHMALYIFAFIGIAALLAFYHYAGPLYLFTAMGFGLAWFGLCLSGFTKQDAQVWSRKMFHLSLVLIIAVCLAISLEFVQKR